MRHIGTHSQVFFLSFTTIYSLHEFQLFGQLYLKFHLPPQEECHYDQDNAEAAENDANQHRQVIIIMRLTQQRLQFLTIRLQ